jgi:methyltransferase (TIGR00027 family)
MVAADASQIANVSLYVAIRTRFIDDVALHAVSEGARQAVLLAAGMDARAFRLTWPSGMTVYELDRPELLSLKQEILDRENARPQCRRIPVGVDMEAEWSAALTGAGFDPAQPSLWIAEGFLFYLGEAAVQRILSRVSALASPGSTLAADFISESFLTSPWMKDALAAMEARGTPWRSGTDQPEEMLAALGWQAEVKEPGNTGAGDSRWPYPIMPRDFAFVPRSFLTKALKDKQN